jgi:hypothetical protein
MCPNGHRSRIFISEFAYEYLFEFDVKEKSVSLQNTKDQLINLLNDKENKVLALSGKWGTGKSHMWYEVKNASDDPNVKEAFYVSLFGLSAMDQIKSKIVQSALSKSDDPANNWTRQIQTGINALKSINKAFSALDELSFLAVPHILKNKVIVLDDIERKNEKLDINEILGFIDEFTQQHKTRFVLILNNDQLNQNKIWETLREKVIDHELRLSTSPVEAFDIAIELTPSQYAEKIKPLVESCGVTNIRIIRKIIKAVNMILNGHRRLSDDVLSRVLPSIVLLSATHYKGIENGPDFNFVLTYNAYKAVTSNLGNSSKQKNTVTEHDKTQPDWALLLRKLNISSCDEFELTVVEFLLSGLLSTSNVEEIIRNYSLDAKKMKFHKAFNDFQTSFIWDYKLSETELLKKAEFIGKNAKDMSPSMVTNFYNMVSELTSGQSVADAAINKWIDAFQKKQQNEANYPLIFAEELHPKIQEELKAIKIKAQTNTTVYKALETIIRKGAWGTKEEIAMRSASVEDMELIIRNSHVNELKLFILGMIDLCKREQSELHYFGSAMDNFIKACRNIVQDENPASSRLRKLIIRLFNEAQLNDCLSSDQQSAMADDTGL